MIRYALLLGSLFVPALVRGAETCPADDSSKVDCGYAGIDHTGCENRGCCWSPAGEGSTTPWCFYKVSDEMTCPTSDSSKIDCGYAGIDQPKCESSGCCWSPSGENSATPWCFHKMAKPASYSLSSITQTATGFTGVLSLNGTGTSTYGADLAKLNLQVLYEADGYVRVKVTDATQARWEIPQDVIARPVVSTKAANLQYSLTYTSSPFSFKVTRKSDNAVIFESGTFIFKNQYIELSTVFDSNTKTFGLGESARLNQALTPGSTFTLWARDVPALVKNTNLYGSFPYYIQVLNGQAHGAMMMNSNGMDITLDSSCLTFNMLGGVIDLYVFAGPTPSDVVKQYLAVVGKPALMPYWSLGFHNCKYGYKTVYEVEDIVTKYKAAGIPLDTQWMDIDYMEAFRDFTVDPVNFPAEEMQKFIGELHSNGQRFVAIIDPGIMVKSGYAGYEEGLQADIFVKDVSGGNYLGQVWPGPVFFPDFLNPKSQDYWTNQFAKFHELAEYDGIWIDMNEVSNFCNSDGRGQVCANSAPNGCPAPGASQTDCCLVCSTPEPSNALDFPPYNIHNNGGLLGVKTMAPSARHYGGVAEYDAHNIYGLTEAIRTNKALRDVRGKRPFSLTRSSFLSSGVHTAKWTGDNEATWDDLKSSIVSIMDFALFGLPMVGADICGFISDTTEELCARWIATGAFYPFSRNHNAIGQAPQELYLWDSVAEVSRKALGLRYQLIPYLYTLFYNAHALGDMVARALWVNFPSDAAAVGIDRQFMLGKAIMVSPVLDQGATSVNAYFPAGLWYDFGARSFFTKSSGATMNLYTPLTSVNVHVRGGNILPLQRSAMTTVEGRATPFTLLVALCNEGCASGSLFWDDGEQIDVKSYLSASYAASVNGTVGSVTGTIATSSYSAASSLYVESIVVMNQGTAAKPSAITLNGAAVAVSSVSVSGGTLTFNLGSVLKITDAFTLSWK